MSTSAVPASSLNQQIQQYFHTGQTDLHDLGKALGTGDLAGAQQAFSDLKSTFEKAQGDPTSTISNPLPNPGTPSPAVGPEIVLNLSSSSTNPEQITIDLKPTQGGGEQVSLTYGQQGSKPQQVTLNLAPNSNEEIVLNLLGPSSSSAGTTSSTTAAGGGLSVSA